jgi:hypothetical protein
MPDRSEGLRREAARCLDAAEQWIPGPELRCERPTRLICLDDLQVVEADSRHQADLELKSRSRGHHDGCRRNRTEANAKLHPVIHAAKLRRSRFCSTH